MAANVTTGRTRTVRYCGAEYTVAPGDVYGRKQVWTIRAGGTVVASHCPTRSRAVFKIHEHAVESGTHPANLADGISYSEMVSKLCN